jgi:hypothetical protein
MLLIAAWFGAFFVQSLLLWSGESRGRHAARLDVLGYLPLETIAFLFLVTGCALVMYQSFSSGLMVFSVAQIDFLFPTPISRRKVLLLKLLKDYAKWSLGIAFFFVFIGSSVYGGLGVTMMPWGLVSIAALVALALMVVNLSHTINIVFTFGYERLRQASVLIKTVLVAAPASAVLFGAYQYRMTGDSSASLLFAADSPIVRAVFAPAKWCADLFFAPLYGVTPEQWGQFGVLWLLTLGSFVLLISRRENVYEPSLGVSMRYARRRMAMRSRDFTDVRVDAMREKGARKARGFSVPPFGRGATAFLWKNLVSRYRIYRGQIALMIILPLVLIAVLARVLPREIMSNVPFLLVYIVWVLSFTAQSEARADLRYANITKAMPIAAWKLILAQVACSVLYTSVGIALLTAYLWFAAPPARGELLIGCAAGAPFLSFAAISAVNITALVYPDLKDMAQNYLCGMTGFLLVSLATAPTAILAVVLHALAKMPIYAVVAIISAVNVVIGMAGISIAGGIFRRFDPTGE